MKVNVKITSPKTLVFNKIQGSNGFSHILVTKGNEIYYDRKFSSQQDCAKMNIPDKGVYTVQINNIVRVSAIPLKKSKAQILLPPPEKDLKKTMGKYKIIKNNGIGRTPMCISTARKVIYYNDRYEKMPVYARKLIFFHELGHRYYYTEAYCDLYATKRMLEAGYNESTCVKTLKDVLGRDAESIERIESVLGQLQS